VSAAGPGRAGLAAVALVLGLGAGWLVGGWWRTRHVHVALPPAGDAASAEPDGSPVIARVGDDVLTVRQLERRWNEVLSPAERQQLRQRGGLATYLDEVVEELLLAQEARRRGLAEDPAVREALRSATNHVITRPLLRAEVREKAFPESELRALYQLRRDEWGEPLRVRVREILVRADGGGRSGKGGGEQPVQDDAAWEEARREAADLRRRILAGEDFGELARQHSDAPTARYLGDVGWVVAGRFFAAYEEAALALQGGELSEPIRTQDGWVLLQAVERQEERIPPFEDRRDELLDALIRDDPGAPARRYRLFVDSLRQEATVAVRAELLEQVGDPGEPPR